MVAGLQVGLVAGVGKSVRAIPGSVSCKRAPAGPRAKESVARRFVVWTS